MNAMTFEQALHELGVRDDTLTAAEKQSLDRDGFVFLHGILPASQVPRMREEVQRLFALERTGEAGAKGECEQIQNKSDAFDICFTHPRLLAAVYHVLRADFASQGIHSRPNPPGKGKQGMHQDGSACRDGVFETCNSIWPLTDFTDENGATRVVPGSHRWGKAPSDVMKDCAERHPDEIRLAMPLGSVAVFNGSLWHSAMLNRGAVDRVNVTSFWALRTKSVFNARLSESAMRRLSPAAQRLFPS